MLEFNHRKNILIVCNLKNGKWKFKSIEMDHDVRRMFKRNHFDPAKDRKLNLPPYVYFSRILDFLSKSRLDKSIYEEYSDKKHIAIITIEERPIHAHSG